ncbi:hypothetical protein B0T22DRAFT_440774 [Podospora appendiculata]|uniref:Uncharacterized protein n=1 Tax=Podospora appendiculata TaxID=314037 RepID=A0AAE0XBA8_9PEZI|nr:hypothetical protein B0T22DRAFT_440774 [Podospora appendiculata]
MCGSIPNHIYFQHMLQCLCECPQRDMATCPHQDYVRAAEDLPPDAEPKTLSGFYLRAEGQPQRHVSWEGHHDSRLWTQCDLYKATHQINKGSQGEPVYIRNHGLELQCPNTSEQIKNILIRRGLCDMCITGHPRGERWQNNPADHGVFLTYASTKHEEARRDEEMRIAAELNEAYGAGYSTVARSQADFFAGTLEDDWVMDNTSNSEFTL